MQVYIVLILIFAIIITLFALFNSVIVPVSLLFFEVEVSLALVIIVSTLIGAVLTALIGTARKIRSGKEIKGLTKKTTELEKQIALKDEALKQRDVMISQKDELIVSQRKTIEEMETNAENASNAVTAENARNAINMTNETVDR